MRYYCNICKETISRDMYQYSMDHFDRPLCMFHQKNRENENAPNSSKITPQARKLSAALDARGIKNKLEQYDGHKHVDISIPWASLDIEIDGKQHSLNPNQLYVDLEREEYSHEDGFETKRYTNEEIDTDVERIADALAEVARRRYREQE